jgi:hypothetical protein
MALTKCEECGREISTKATTCPGCGMPVTQPQDPPPDPGNRTGPKHFGCLHSLVIVGGGVIALFVVAIAIAVSLESDEPPSETPTRPASLKATAIPVGGNTPEKDSRQVRQMITKAVGSEGLSFEVNDYHASPERKIIQVRFALDDNLTGGMIRGGARLDIKSILRAVGESGINCHEVTVFGSFPLVDKYGNSKSEVVVKATYSGAKISRINWPNFLTDNVYTIAESTWLHPAFRD